MIRPHSRLGVAVSGGADSVVLLHLLSALRERFPCELTVLHANHGLRGQESDGDEAFVRALAEELGIPCLSELVALEPGNLEQSARDARRAFFRKSGLDRIALGHTRSDQAETVLYRFLRGSGSAGLAAMRPVSEDWLIRPLLDASREEVREWARDQGITWREDSTNADSRFARNFLRNEAMPALAQNFNTKLEAVLAGTAALAQAEEDYWSEFVSQIYCEHVSRSDLGSFLHISQLNSLPLAVRRRLIRRAVEEIRGNLRGIDLQHIESILRLFESTEGHDRVIIPGLDALRSYGTLLLAHPGRLNEDKRHYRVDIGVSNPANLPFGLGFIRLDASAKELQNCANVRISQTPSTEVAYLDSDALRGPMYVRNWEPGDGLRMPGHSGFIKLKTLFQEHRVLLWERRHWPVLVCGDDVIWTRRFGCSAEVAAGPETQQTIRLMFSA